MKLADNYLTQANQAKQHFLTYDQDKLIRKFALNADETYIYVNFLCQPFRIHRATGHMEKQELGEWVDGNRFEEVMTLLDLLCDSRDDRHLSQRWKNMASFGLQFHQNLLEEKRSPMADRIHREPEAFIRACRALDATAVEGADLGFGVELFDGLRIGIQFWFGDDEFFPRLRYLWDENANQYLRYETMYFAVDALQRRIEKLMNEKGAE